MPGLWKAWKAKSRLPPLSTSPLEIPPKGGAIPTFPQLRRRGRLGKWKTQKRIPTFPPPRMYMDLKEKNRAAGELRPPRGGGRPPPPHRLEEIGLDLGEKMFAMRRKKL